MRPPARLVREYSSTATSTVRSRALLLPITIAAPARAQFVVVDHGNLAQAVLIAERTLREYPCLLQNL